MIPILVLVLALQPAPGEPSASPPPPPEAPAMPPRRLDDPRPLTGAVPQGSYEAGVRGAFTRSQSLQGPLDGTWLLKDAAGAGLYRVQLVDPGFADAPLEGVWSDLRVDGAPDASGFFTGVMREGARLTLRFARPDSGAMVATLNLRPDRAYAGELRASRTGRPDAVEAVTLVRP